uniref:GRAM domain-containing protein n=1 Tax=Panagrolaimus superbus TaxID=310955 RepID=A0A914Y527_9BILA
MPTVRNFGTDSPPPQEPFINDPHLPTDLQLLEMIKKNYDLMSLITEIEQPGHETPRHNNLDNRHLLSPLPYLRHRAQSFAVPTIDIRDSYLSTSSSQSSMNEENIIAEKTLCENLRDQWSDFYGQVTDALSETNDDIKARKSPEAQKLSPNALKRDIKRCLSECQPYIETAVGLKDLFVWKNPMASLCTFFVYIYCIYRGWIGSLFFFIILFQLTLNYFTEHKGINIGLNFLPRKEVIYKRVDYSGAQLVFDVARKVQVILKILADIFEKARNLFTWKKPEVTFKFFIIMLIFFLASISCSNSTCLTIIGFGFGGKAFITTYLFHRFPRLRHMFDIIVYFYDRLPTSRTEVTTKILSKLSSSSLNSMKTAWKSSNDPLPKSQSTNNILHPEMDIRRRSIGVISYQAPKDCVLPASATTPPSPILHATENCSNVPSVITDNDDLMSISDDDSSSVDIFLITRSCVMVDKERPFPFGMNSGTLILNEKMLKFRFKKLKEGVKETLQIPFDDITSVKKIRTLKTFSLMPGSSKALELKISTKKKAIQFIGIQKRDNFYESLIESARMAGVELILNDEDNL